MRGSLLVPGLLAFAATAAAPPPSPDAQLRAIIAPVSEAQLKHSIETLVSFGTRHTLSSQTDPKRGIGAALDWARGEFQRDSAGCGNCLTIVDPSEFSPATRIPTPTRVRDMVAIQRGTERPNDVVIITGAHRQPRQDPLNANLRAPARTTTDRVSRPCSRQRASSPSTIPGHHRLCGNLRRRAGALRREGDRDLRQGAGLERRRRPQQRHHRQQLRFRRRVRLDARARPLGRAALAGSRRSCWQQRTPRRRE